MKFTRPQRLAVLPPYLFAEIDHKKKAALQAGKDVIDFGVGDPDHPTPQFIIEALQRAAEDPANHRYPLDQGSPPFRSAAAEWFERRFGVRLDPARELLLLIGSKEGLGHVPLAVLNPEDVALVPSPGYPVYRGATVFAGGRPYEMPLTAEHHWLPDLQAIPPDIAAAAKLMFLNYPNNPTAAVAELAFFERVVEFARRHELVVVQDAAYSELAYGTPPPSILQVDGAREVAVEFHSLSKTFNMTGWRIGFAAGCPEVLSALAAIKTNLDSGQFNAIQLAAAEALTHADHVSVRAMIDVYRQRRDVLVEGLRSLGYEVVAPQATFYVWMPVPAGEDSMGFASRLLEECNIVVVPGLGFGRHGEGYVRFALSVPTERIHQALQRLRGAGRS